MTTLPTCDSMSKNFITVEEALEHILSSVQCIKQYETIDIRRSLGRVLAEDITAPFNVPPHRNSAMDGYAVKLSDISEQEKTTLSLVSESFAGHPYSGVVQAGECIRIMTGAVVPDDTDVVIMQEHVKRTDNLITVSNQHKLGQNIRHPGEDMPKGSLALEAGKQINSADLGLLASLGIGEIKVTRKPRVVFFSTGDELKSIGETLDMGNIYDSNRYTLFGLLQKLDVDIIDMGVIPDQQEAIEKAFEDGSKLGDTLITSGGVSVGDADFVTATLEKMGQVGFWKIAMKPGKPLAFGKINNSLFFGLPGNPVSVMATFILFVRPALQKLKGLSNTKTKQLTAVCDSHLKKKAGRKDHQRGIYFQDENGTLHVSTTGLQGSHVLSSMSKANCFIVIPKDSGDVQIGEEVTIYPFDELI